MAIGEKITPCPLYGKCGGCGLQHIGYEEQLESKKERLNETMARAGFTGAIEAVASPPWEYRNRFSFHAIRGNRGPKVGFKARSSEEIIPIDDCPIADPGLRALLRENAILPPPHKDRFTVYGRTSGAEFTLLSEGPVGGRDCRSGGAVTIAGKNIRLDAGVFFQANAAALEKLIPHIRAAAASTAAGSAFADLYSGVGTFSVFIADLFERGDLLEQSGAALECAKVNLASHSGLKFFAQNDDAWARRNNRAKNYAFAAADPPRAGFSRSMAAWLAERGPAVLAYVSCEPASLARDCRVLSNGGYEIESLTLFDFYPQTEHIESLAILHRR